MCYAYAPNELKYAYIRELIAHDTTISTLCPREESNLYYELRKLASCPLNDEGYNILRMFARTFCCKMFLGHFDCIRNRATPLLHRKKSAYARLRPHGARSTRTPCPRRLPQEV